MAADLYILIRNEFNDLTDIAQAKMYAERTISRIEEQLGEGTVTAYNGCPADLDELAYADFNVESENFWMSLTLRNGYWIGYTAIHHSHIIDDYKGEFMLCKDAHFMAKLLGKSEVWYTNDMVMDQYDTNISLDDFIAEKQKQGYYAEFNPEELLKLPRRERPLYSVYHDKFED